MRCTRRTSLGSRMDSDRGVASTMRWMRWRSGSRCTNVNYIVDADVEKFFDRLSHSWLMRFLEHRHRRSRASCD